MSGLGYIVTRTRLAATRAVAPALALALAGVVVVPGFSSAAHAAGGSLSELQTIASTCSGLTTVTVSADLADPAEMLEVACDLTIDLDGFDLERQERRRRAPARPSPSPTPRPPGPSESTRTRTPAP